MTEKLLLRYCRTGRGEAFVKAGRPSDGPVADRFSKAVAEYDQMADAIWYAKWEQWQREEWERIFR